VVARPGVEASFETWWDHVYVAAKLAAVVADLLAVKARYSPGLLGAIQYPVSDACVVELLGVWTL